MGGGQTPPAPALKVATVDATTPAPFTSALIRPCPAAGPVGLGEAVARSGHRESAIRLRGDLDPIRRSIVRRWRRRVGARRGRRDWLDRHGSPGVVDAVR